MSEYNNEHLIELEAENERLRARCSPSKTVAIDDYVHYVSEPVADEIERLRAERDALRELLQDARDHPGDPYVADRIDAALAERKTVCPACEGAGFTGLGNVCKKCGGSANTPATGGVTVGCPECGCGQWYVGTAVEQCRNCGYSRPNQAESSFHASPHR